MPASLLRHARLDADLTLFGLAQRIGISAGRLSYIERGLVAPTPAEQTAIELVLGEHVPIARSTEVESR